MYRTLELIKSKQYKVTKYARLHENLITEYSDLKLNRYTVEVTTLGTPAPFLIFKIDSFKYLIKACIDNQSNIIVRPPKFV